MPSEESADPHNGFGKSYQIRKKLYLIPTFRLIQSIVGKKKRGQSLPSRPSGYNRNNAVCRSKASSNRLAYGGAPIVWKFSQPAHFKNSVERSVLTSSICLYLGGGQSAKD